MPGTDLGDAREGVYVGIGLFWTWVLLFHRHELSGLRISSVCLTFPQSEAKGILLL